jgi:hypothetical protein
MPNLLFSQSMPSTLGGVYDAVLLEMAVMHPRISGLHELALKARLMSILLLADEGQTAPDALMRMFRQAVMIAEQDNDASVGLDL